MRRRLTCPASPPPRQGPTVPWVSFSLPYSASSTGLVARIWGTLIDAWGPPLLLEKDDRIVRTPRPWQPPHIARNGSSRVTVRGFSQPSDLVGVFSCVGGAGTRRTRVLYVHNSPGGESGRR